MHAAAFALILGVVLATVPRLPASEPVKQDFESATVGSEPDGFFIIDGKLTVEEFEGGKVLAVSPAPVLENGAILGDSMKGGGSVEAKVRADRRRRSFPRFGVGLHGLSGYRLRVVPAQGQIELVKNEEVVKAETFQWTPDEWLSLRLSISPTEDGKWKVEGRVWKSGEEAPEKPGIEVVHEGASIGTGKASVWGTPYADLPIYFDDIVVTAASES